MKIEYKSRKLEKACTIFEEARKSYGDIMAERLHQRIDEITAADSIEFLCLNHIGRCHLLKENLSGMYAMDLRHPYRLVFTEKDRVLKIVKILEIIDIHINKSRKGIE